MRGFLTFVVVACSSIAAYAQDHLQSGVEPPLLRIDQWLQADAGFDGRWSGLRGKVVVLDFWATWCAPCVHAIPHLNQFAEEFHGKDVVFLAITDDNIDRLAPFLAKQPMKAIIGIDTERRNWKIFSIHSIPRTILIGKDGRIIAVTRPGNLTAGVLHEALAGGKPVLAPIEGIPSDLEWDEHSVQWEDGVKPVMYAIIKPIKTSTAGAWPRPGHITADGVPLQVLVQIAYQTDNHRIDWRMPKDDQAYRAAFKVPDNRNEQLVPYMQQTLATLFAFDARWEKQERDVYVLRQGGQPSSPRKSLSEKERVQMMRGQITLERQPVSKLCDMLQTPFNSVVVDETGLDGAYDFDLPYQPGQPEVTVKALGDIGLEIGRARRNIPVLVVTPKAATLP